MCTHLIIIGVVCTCPYVWVQVYLLPVVLAAALMTTKGLYQY